MKFNQPDGRFERLRRWTGRVFSLTDLGRAYRLTFNMSKPCQLVLKDIAEVANVNRRINSAKIDPYQLAFDAGKLAVWQHIQFHLRLDDGQLMALYTDGNLHREEN